jgi:NAD(P)-dependent dehydrogenase (short-subunit alcohol dehydrogenase family)
MAEKDGHVALVTGTTGIGRATALRLARDGVGVMALGIDRAGNAALAATALAEGLQVELRLADVSQPAQVAEAVAETERLFGGLDIIVNAAAVHPYGDAVETDPETFARCLAVNVGGVHLTAHFGVPVMRRRGGGVIINLSSVQGHACQAGVAAYVASKGAIHAMTRAMAVDFAPSHIRVLSVSPGSVRSPILELAARRFDGPDADVEATFARFGAAHPLGRIGEPEEVAELIAFLASGKAAFMTGADIRIDGGLTAALGMR